MDWEWLAEFFKRMIKPVVALSIVAMAVVLCYFQRLGIEFEIAYSFFRAFLQLSVIGFVLQFIFNQNNAVWIILIYLFMVSVAAYTLGQRAKHVPVDMKKIHTKDNIADFLTKSVNTDKFEWCRSSSGLAKT